MGNEMKKSILVDIDSKLDEIEDMLELAYQLGILNQAERLVGGSCQLDEVLSELVEH
jgi:hypothetical protein